MFGADSKRSPTDYKGGRDERSLISGLRQAARDGARTAGKDAAGKDKGKTEATVTLRGVGLVAGRDEGGDGGDAFAASWRAGLASTVAK